MTLATKFDIGEKVWVLFQEERWCPTCGQKISKYNPFGKAPTTWRMIGPLKIKQASSSSGWERNDSYQFETLDRTLKPFANTSGFSDAMGVLDRNIFREEMEAQAECEKRNLEDLAKR